MMPCHKVALFGEGGEVGGEGGGQLNKKGVQRESNPQKNSKSKSNQIALHDLKILE